MGGEKGSPKRDHYSKQKDNNLSMINKEKNAQAISDYDSEPFKNESPSPKKINKHEANMDKFPLDENMDTQLDTSFEEKETNKNDNYPKEKDKNLYIIDKEKDVLFYYESESFQTESPSPRKLNKPGANLANIPLDENLDGVLDPTFEEKDTYENNNY